MSNANIQRESIRGSEKGAGGQHQSASMRDNFTRAPANSPELITINLPHGLVAVVERRPDRTSHITVAFDKAFPPVREIPARQPSAVWNMAGHDDLAAFRINTTDPRFDPKGIITVNGYAFAPVQWDDGK